MAELLDDAEFTLSGAYGELYYVDPLGIRAPRRIFEVTNFRATEQGSRTKIQIAGNRQGSKRGSKEGSGEFGVRLVDAFWKRIAAEHIGGDDDERRAQRDAGTRRRQGFTLQAWLDDPDGLGKLGYQFEGVVLSKWDFGWDLSTIVTTESHPFDFRNVRPLEEFEKVGNEIDPTSGMPAVTVITPDS